MKVPIKNLKKGDTFRRGKHTYKVLHRGQVTNSKGETFDGAKVQLLTGSGGEFAFAWNLMVEKAA